MEKNEQEILQEENELFFNQFNHHDAWLIGNEILRLYCGERSKANGDKGIGIRISLQNLVLFQYLMDGKKDDSWLIRKENTVMKFSHSSLYIRAVNDRTKQYEAFKEDKTLAICGGGFPIRMEGQVRGSISVSGLVHHEDHDLIIEALRNHKHKEVR
ncbi:heme-binding protein [Holdemania massiliensis]|uniref:heme-binding protein n=1 Tax=Holdemania massiliensis TaxID=1468449 RepID=UPI001F05EC55|nr:heme-binding protein [Holdemania massiliensis]MCH1939718.1 heme-binding protein [Holdemania massiliensis]